MGLETVEIVLELEDAFGISIPDDRAASNITLGDTRTLIVELLIAKGRVASAELEHEVWERLVTVICVQTGIRRTALHVGSNWVGEVTRYG